MKSFPSPRQLFSPRENLMWTQSIPEFPVKQPVSRLITAALKQNIVALPAFFVTVIFVMNQSVN